MLNIKGFGIVKKSFSMSVKNIISNKMRSFLTTLGIIIGVMSVIALMTIVEGVTNELMSSLSDMGAGMLSVTATGTTLQPGLSKAHLEQLEELDNVLGVSPNVSLTTSAVRNGKVVESVTIKGKSEAYFRSNDVINYGRPLYESDMDGNVAVCIIDETFAKNLFLGENPLGIEVVLGSYTYKVVGVQKKGSGGLTDDMMQSTEGGSVLVPYENVLRMIGRILVTSFDVYVDDVELTSKTQEELEETLRQIFDNDEDAYWVMNLESLLDMMDTMMSMMTGLLAGIASISLLVGGIGIMNMMLVSVTERTKEIGLRKALGATPGRRQIQFLIEAIILSLTGGVIGLIVGLAISAVAASLLEITFTISVSAIRLGLGFSAAVGIIFGWAPAKKASELNPIDALRSE